MFLQKRAVTSALLKIVLSPIYIKLRAECLPSVINRYTNALKTLLTRGFEDSTYSLAIPRCWNESVARRFSIPALWRPPVVSTPSVAGVVEPRLELGGSAPAFPTVEYHAPDGTKSGVNSGPSAASYVSVATAAVVPSRVVIGNESYTVAASPAGINALTAAPEPELVPAPPGN